MTTTLDDATVPSPLVTSPSASVTSRPSRWSDAALRASWARYAQRPSTWTEGAEAIVARVQGASDAQFRTESIQRALWQSHPVASAGPGNAINTSAAHLDAEVLDRLCALRRREWPSDAEVRASLMQQEFDATMSRLGKLGLKARPWAKLLRVFAILIPQHLTCLLQREALAKVVQRLFGRDSLGSAIQEHVRIRARLRDALGAERDLHECVQRVTFCWSLQEVTADEEADPPDAPPATPAPVDGAESESVVSGPREPPLALWSFGRQYAGIPAITGYSWAWRDLLRAAQAGQTPDAIVEEARQNGAAGAESAKSLRYAVSRLLGLGLLRREGDLLRPSDEGMRVLEGDDDPLIEQILVRTYGFAQLLRLLALRKSLSRNELFDAMRAEYPSWTSNFAPSALITWAIDLGLAEYSDTRAVALTPYGAEWHTRLPEQLPKPSIEALPDTAVEFAEVAASPKPLSFPSFGEIEARLRADPRAAGFVLEAATLRALHAAWTCNPVKHFVILSGLSGTGKTAVLGHYARAVCAALSLDPARHLQLVAVSPDWHDPSGLLGYFNPLHEDPTYQVEPALRLVLDAATDPSRPYFLVLDEMNLARVERYMAPFLSAMETGAELTLHASVVAVNEVPPRVSWPSNLFLGGTVNMDESTHPFSDKVLDRAFTMEFWRVDLPTFFAGRAARHAAAEETLLALHDALQPARRHFGYRTAGEVIDFVRTMVDSGADESVALDHAVFAKVLPKLRGEDAKVLRDALEQARKVAATRAMDRCAEKLKLMQQRLTDTGVTRFWS